MTKTLEAHDKLIREIFEGKGTASPFILTQEVRSKDTWTPAMLGGRQKRLVNVLSTHWDLEISADDCPPAVAATTGGLVS